MSAMAASRARDEERQFAQKMADRAEAKKREGIRRNLEARVAAWNQMLGRGPTPTRGPGDELYLESGTQMVPVDDPRVAFQKGTAPPMPTDYQGLVTADMVGEHKMGLQAAERAAKAKVDAAIDAENRRLKEKIDEEARDAAAAKKRLGEQRRFDAIQKGETDAQAHYKNLGYQGKPVDEFMARRQGEPVPQIMGGLTPEQAMNSYRAGQLERERDLLENQPKPTTLEAENAYMAKLRKRRIDAEAMAPGPERDAEILEAEALLRNARALGTSTQSIEVYDPKTGKLLFRQGPPSKPGAAGGGPKQSAFMEQYGNNAASALLGLEEQYNAYLEGNKKGVGWKAHISRVLGTQIAPQFGIMHWADVDLADFQTGIGQNAWGAIRTLNEEGRLSDKDAEFLKPLVPLATDSQPEFEGKMNQLIRQVDRRLMLHAATLPPEQRSYITRDPVDLLKIMGDYDERTRTWSGLIMGEEEGAAPPPFTESDAERLFAIRFGPRKYKAEDIRKMVTDGKLTEDQGVFWLTRGNFFKAHK